MPRRTAHATKRAPRPAPSATTEDDDSNGAGDHRRRKDADRGGAPAPPRPGGAGAPPLPRRRRDAPASAGREPPSADAPPAPAAAVADARGRRRDAPPALASVGGGVVDAPPRAAEATRGAGRAGPVGPGGAGGGGGAAPGTRSTASAWDSPTSCGARPTVSYPSSPSPRPDSGPEGGREPSRGWREASREGAGDAGEVVRAGISGVAGAGRDARARGDSGRVRPLQGVRRGEEDVGEMEEKKRREKERGRAGSDGRSSSASGRKVKSAACYDLLGVSPSVSQSEIRSAYRKATRKVHPDKNPDDPDAPRKFRELGAAYRMLSDPARREEYDASGVGVDPEESDSAGGQAATLDPLVFFAMLFGSDRVDPYVGKLSVTTTFDLLLKLGTSKAAASATSFETWEDVKSAFGIREAALWRRKREAEIASHLRERVEGYVKGYLAPGAFAEGAGSRCGGSRGGTGTTARCSCWPSVP
ncbi:hypothetical protein ACHAWF_008872, partial [Thalassiosira exigua]